ncbi:MAG: phosphoenolpyruvate--protein phosphotransferase, partial [Elusimicrobiota bacterium]
GSVKEKETLKKLKQKLGDRFYCDIMQCLTHITPSSPREAKSAFNSIISHKDKLRKQLGRPIGIQVAAVDYLKNKKKILKQPFFIEEKKLSRTAGNSLKETFAGLLDKNMLYYDLNKEISRTRRYGTPFSILMIDIDNLNEINKKCGKPAGDRVLRETSEILQNNIRSSDALYKFGDDEYVILLPKCRRDSAKKVAEKLINFAGEISFQENKCGISISAGAACFDKNNIKNMHKVMDIAEKALSNAKKTGKGKVSSVQKDTTLEIEKRARKEEDLTSIKSLQRESRFETGGTPISPGTSLGKAFIYKDILLRTVDIRKLDKEELPEELSRIKKALKIVEEDIIKTRDRVEDLLDKKHGDIFDSHRLLLNDPQILSELKSMLYNKRINAEYVVKLAFKHIENRFKTSDNKIIREKSDDIEDLSKRLIRALTKTGKNILSKIPPQSVIVANRLLPSDTINLKRSNVNAIITEKGSISSHAAILARSLNIPCMAEPECSLEVIKSGCDIIVDTERKKIIINPAESERKRYRALIKEKNRKKSEIIKKTQKIKLSKHEAKIKILANVASPEECAKAASYGSDGVGIYRIESLYMGKSVPPTEEELLETFKKSFKPFNREEITVRLLDVGGDKSLLYMNSKDDRISSLGLRGVRILLRNPKVLHTQLRAMIKSSRDYNIKILVPMVTISDEIKQIRKTLNQVKKELRIKKDIKLGSMIETPAAAIKIKDILKASDFVSIGTNDLIQYTMASGRENISVSDYYEAGSEIVMTFIKKIIKESEYAQKDCILCGEMASNISFTNKLLDYGLKNFSVSVPYIPQLKNKIATNLNLL